MRELSLLTSEQVGEYLAGNQALLVPIGSFEQHGPVGLIGTDIICAQAMCREASRLTGVLIGPSIPVGMALHHMAFPGTVSLRPSTLIALIRDIVLSLAEHGFRRMLFVNGHGGNTPSIRAAFYEAYAALREAKGAANAPDLRCELANWWEMPSVAPLVKSLFGDQEGTHATPSEVSVSWAEYPSLARPRALAPAPPVSRFYGPEDFRRRFQDGRIGANSGLATVEAGQGFIASAGADIAELLTKLIQDP
jgi:creatinine amidohydrolase